jgi:hypothetical protein
MSINTRPAKPEDSGFISLKLAEYFEDRNKEMAFEYYNSDAAKFEKIINERITNNDGSFYYLISHDQFNIINGFIGYYINPKKKGFGEIQIVIVENKSEEASELLLNKAIQHMKDKGVFKVIIEKSEKDIHLENLCNSDASLMLGANYLIDTKKL